MRLSSLPLLLALAWPATVSAQAMVQALPGSSDADLLAATMRRVAANPLDLDALLTAGEQSLKVDDLAGAASLFARAEKIDPRSGRVKAGMASILVRSERPGEALRYFAQAEAAGLDPRRFAADRGFAYDLTGDQPRAQRDYRTAIAAGADDETVRRYALSLGISGRGEEALRELQPLLGRSDRAAWRARAFILAMTGDQPGAERIAATMMPAGMAQGLRPFFERLPGLPAADRAFAVHFGEVRPTPERIADARLAPQLAPLPAEPRPLQVAAATQTTTRQETRSERRNRERAERRAARERVALAARSQRGRVQPGRVTLPAGTGLPAAAAVVSPPIQVAALGPARSAPTAVPPIASGIAAAPISTASAVTVPAPGFTVAPTVPSGPAVASISTSADASNSTAATGIAPTVIAPVTLAAATNVAVPGESGLAPLVASPATTVAASAVPPVAPPAPATVALAAVGTRSAARPTAVSTQPRRTARMPAADSVLARIVASLSIPAAELGVTAPARAQPVPAGTGEGAARTAEALRTKAARDAEADAAAQRLVRDTRRGRKSAGDAVELAAVEGGTSRAARRRVAKPDAVDDADTAAATTKKVDPKKALADRKAAAEKKAAADKAATERAAARAHPSRIWVQVAGGAYAGDLPKAWAATRAKAPQVFGGRGAYSAKLRATNRVVTGPFKTDAEARAFVNQLAKAGVSAFPFTSDAGEAVTRLPAK